MTALGSSSVKSFDLRWRIILFKIYKSLIIRTFNFHIKFYNLNILSETFEKVV